MEAKDRYGFTIHKGNKIAFIWGGEIWLGYVYTIPVVKGKVQLVVEEMSTGKMATIENLKNVVKTAYK